MEENRKDPGISRQKTASYDSETAVFTNEYTDENSALETLKKRVNESWEQCDLLYLTIGRDLLTAKSFFRKYGMWLDWLNGNYPFSIRQG